MFGRLSAAARRREHLTQERMRGAIERGLGAALGREFQRTAQSLASAGPGQRDAIITGHEAQVEALLRTFYGQVFRVFGGRAVEALHALPKKDADETLDKRYAAAARRFISTWSNRRSGEISKTTNRKLDRILAQATADGLHEDVVAGIIVDKIGGSVGLARARTIARTETHSASQDAGFQVAQDSGLKLKKQWVSTEDDRTREDHVEANDQIVDLEDPFKIGDDELYYPGDPTGAPEQVVNCRCVCIYIPLAR